MAGPDNSRSHLAVVLDRLADLESRHRGSDFDALRAAVIEGGDGAWERFVEKYSRFVYSVALQLVAGSADPSEAAASIYARTFERLAARRYRLLENFGGRCRFTTYLYRIVLTERKEFFLRERRVEAEPLDERAGESGAVDERPSPVLRPELLLETVRKALSRLEPRERTLLLCRFRDGLKFREIADFFGLKDTNAAARAVYLSLERLQLIRDLDGKAQLGASERQTLAEALRQQLLMLRDTADGGT